MTVRVVDDGAVRVVEIDRPAKRGAVDAQHAAALLAAFEEFDQREDLAVAVLTGSEGHFCAGADLEAVASGTLTVTPYGEGPGPMGPTRLALSKPVIAAIEGHAVAGGLELALWCDLRVVSEAAVLGVFCRRWGVPLIDGGTVRLPRLVGESVALDLILTGRAVEAAEALRLGLANRVVPAGTARSAALALAHELAALPQACLRSDRGSVLAQQGLEHDAAMAVEWGYGAEVLGEAGRGAARFVSGEGRHGAS